MDTEQFTIITLFFYIIQNLARCYYFSSVLLLRRETTKSKIWFYFSSIFISTLISYSFRFHMGLKGIMDPIFYLIITHYFFIGKIYIKVLHYILSINVALITEFIGLGISSVILGVNPFTSTKIAISLLVPGTILICVLHVLLARFFKRNQEYVNPKYTIELALLTITQSLLVYALVFRLVFSLSIYAFPILIISVILSYYLIQFLSSYIYEEYRYKENTLFLIKNYERQLQEYMKLKDNEEVQYLRHEIMNQMIGLEQSKRRTKQ